MTSQTSNFELKIDVSRLLPKLKGFTLTYISAFGCYGLCWFFVNCVVISNDPYAYISETDLAKHMYEHLVINNHQNPRSFDQSTIIFKSSFDQKRIELGFILNQIFKLNFEKYYVDRFRGPVFKQGQKPLRPNGLFGFALIKPGQPLPQGCSFIDPEPDLHLEIYRCYAETEDILVYNFLEKPHPVVAPYQNKKLIIKTRAPVVEVAEAVGDVVVEPTQAQQQQISFAKETTAQQEKTASPSLDQESVAAQSTPLDFQKPGGDVVLQAPTLLSPSADTQNVVLNEPLTSQVSTGELSGKVKAPTVQPTAEGVEALTKAVPTFRASRRKRETAAYRAASKITSIQQLADSAKLNQDKGAVFSTEASNQTTNKAAVLTKNQQTLQPEVNAEETDEAFFNKMNAYERSECFNVFTKPN